MSEEPLIAIFVDYENLAIGARDSKWRTINIDLILKRLLEKGRIVYKRAYCDWSQYRGDVREFHARGIELVDIPRSKMSGKNSADIRMVVDALDLCYSKDHIEIFALLTGDSDFSPLVSKLKENHKRVIGCGVKNSTSTLLMTSCDEFLYYDDLVRKEQPKHRTPAPAPSHAPSPATGSSSASTTRGRSSRRRTRRRSAVAPASSAGASSEPLFRSVSSVWGAPSSFGSSLMGANRRVARLGLAGNSPEVRSEAPVAPARAEQRDGHQDHADDDPDVGHVEGRPVSLAASP